MHNGMCNTLSLILLGGRSDHVNGGILLNSRFGDFVAPVESRKLKPCFRFL